MPQKTRVILVVIDALRYDFGLFDKSKYLSAALFSMAQHLKIHFILFIFLDKENALPFENKLPIFNQMLTSHPNNTRFMKLVADAPTTTLQRLKGITTGSLPTFIDIGSNFATSEINEDNFIDQVTNDCDINIEVSFD